MKRTNLIQNVKSGIADKQRQAQTSADFGMQQQIRAQARQRSVGDPAQMAAQNIQQVSQRRAQISQQGMQKAQQAAQLEQQKMKIAKARQLSEMQQKLGQEARENAQKLFGLDQTLKSNLLDRQLTFQKDELGRTIFNDRQLADYKLATAKSQIELQEYGQMVQQETQKKLQVLGFFQAKLKQELENTMKMEETQKNNKLKVDLRRSIVEIEKAIAKSKADAANKAGQQSAMGSIVGMGIGVAATVMTGGAAAPFIPVAGAAGSAMFTGFDFDTTL